MNTVQKTSILTNFMFLFFAWFALSCVVLGGAWQSILQGNHGQACASVVLVSFAFLVFIRMRILERRLYSLGHRYEPISTKR